MSEEEEKELTSIISKMGKLYGEAQICVNETTCYNLEPGLTDIMSESTNYTLRTFVWEVCYRAFANMQFDSQ